MTSRDEALRVSSRKDLAEFIDRILEEIAADPSQLANVTTERYLEALSGYLRDLAGFVKNNDWPQSADEASWALFAAILSLKFPPG